MIKRAARKVWPGAMTSEIKNAIEASGRWFISVTDDSWVCVSACHNDRRVARRMALAACKEAGR